MQKILTHPALRAPLPTSREGNENPDFSANTLLIANKLSF